MMQVSFACLFWRLPLPGCMADFYRRTKIVATWGPAVASEDALRRLVRAGVDVFRLNFSHGTHEEFEEAVPRIRRVAAEEGRVVALLQDIQGPRVRTGPLQGGGPVELSTGSTVTLTSADEPGTSARFSIGYAGLANDVLPGHRVLIADGTLVLRVRGVQTGEVTATVESGGLLGEHKGVNLPDTDVSAEPLTAKDREDIALGARMGVDYVALSFVRRREDILACRRLINQQGGSAPVIAKIEHPQAIANLEEVLSASDGVMVARGDLGVEVSPERVPLLQKQIILRANEMGLPVITATQMLESMVERPTPTRAEASDIANAVLDGTDALMLSAETAIGRYPVEAVETMARIAVETERTSSRSFSYPTNEQAHVLARAASTVAKDLDAQALLVFTSSGHSGKVLSHQRPEVPVYALTEDPAVCRNLALWYGVTPVLMRVGTDTEAMVDLGIAELRRRGALAPGDRAVVMGSAPKLVEGLTNLITVRIVPGDGGPDEAT